MSDKLVVGIIKNMAAVTENILVVGCGIVGLNTALRLQQDFPKANITIMAEKLGNDIVSNVAAGIFRASKHGIVAETEELGVQWIKDSWNFYQNLRVTQPCKDTGIVKVYKSFRKLI